ncbi:MAG: ATP-binding cassette domain-containing protein [Thiotrichales bacterium]
MTSSALLEVRRGSVEYALERGGTLRALREVSLTLAGGETLGVVGESGSGKSTLARAMLGLIPLSAGTLHWQGQDTRGWRSAERLAFRRQVQCVFQDPLDALDPRLTVGASIAEPLRHLRPDLSRAERAARVAAMLEQVGLAAAQATRYPHEFSGGQCQRIGIARALVCEPRLVICDEPVSALDVSVQAQIINLLLELRARHGLAILFISHDLNVVRHLCQRVLVLHAGEVVETAPVAQLFTAPTHPYTQRLLASIPRLPEDAGTPRHY